MSKGTESPQQALNEVVMRVPLFPLNSLILPRGRIPLQLFEPRYVDMLSRCLRHDRGFVVVLIRDGQEDSPTCEFYDIGTYVRVVDFKPLDNGMLGITVQGEAKVAVLECWRQDDGLNVGDVEWLMDEPAIPTPSFHDELVGVLRALLQHPAIRELELDIDFSDSREVGWRLTELLPLDKTDKQRLAEMVDPLERLESLHEIIDALE